MDQQVVQRRQSSPDNKELKHSHSQLKQEPLRAQTERKQSQVENFQILEDEEGTQSSGVMDFQEEQSDLKASGLREGVQDTRDGNKKLTQSLIRDNRSSDGQQSSGKKKDQLSQNVDRGRESSLQNRSKVIGSADRGSHSRQSYFQQEKQNEINKNNEILLNKIMKIIEPQSSSSRHNGLPPPSKSHNHQSFADSQLDYIAHSKQLARGMGGKRKQEMQRQMQENFKMLQRLQNTKSQYSIQKLGVEDLNTNLQPAKTKFTNNLPPKSKAKSKSQEKGAQKIQNLSNQELDFSNGKQRYNLPNEFSEGPLRIRKLKDQIQDSQDQDEEEEDVREQMINGKNQIAQGQGQQNISQDESTKQLRKQNDIYNFREANEKEQEYLSIKLKSKSEDRKTQRTEGKDLHNENQTNSKNSGFLPQIESSINTFNRRIFQKESQSKVKQIVNQQNPEYSFQGVKLVGSQTRIVNDISMQYEKGKLRRHFVELKQVYNLPQDREVLTQSQCVIQGKKGDFLVELSQTKLKFYITAVKIRDPHKFFVLEHNRFKFEKFYKNIGESYTAVIQRLAFCNKDTLLIRDFDKLLLQPLKRSNYISQTRIKVISRSSNDREAFRSENSPQIIKSANQGLKGINVVKNVEIPLLQYQIKKANKGAITQRQMVSLEDLKLGPQKIVIQQKETKTYTIDEDSKKLPVSHHVVNKVMIKDSRIESNNNLAINGKRDSSNLISQKHDIGSNVNESQDTPVLQPSQEKIMKSGQLKKYESKFLNDINSQRGQNYAPQNQRENLQDLRYQGDQMTNRKNLQVKQSIKSQSNFKMNSKQEKNEIDDFQMNKTGENDIDVRHQTSNKDIQALKLKPGARLKGEIKKDSLRTIIERASESQDPFQGGESSIRTGMTEMDQFIFNKNQQFQGNNEQTFGNQSHQDSHSGDQEELLNLYSRSKSGSQNQRVFQQQALGGNEPNNHIIMKKSPNFGIAEKKRSLMVNQSHQKQIYEKFIEQDEIQDDLEPDQ